MPTYTFRNKKTDEKYDKIMSYEEMLKYKRALQIHQEVNRIGVQNTDQRREIINHFHQVINPDPIPVIQQEDHTKLIEALENAIANQNHAFLHSAHEMGLTMKEIIEMMKQKDGNDFNT